MKEIKQYQKENQKELGELKEEKGIKETNALYGDDNEQIQKMLTRNNVVITGMPVEEKLDMEIG